MLVCNVSLRPPRTAIAAAIAEMTSATDATATGIVVFATLVDDPASVRDTLDAYLGEIMVEAASAAATVNAGLIYAAAIVEAAATTDAFSGVVPAIVTAGVAEAVTAVSTQDGTVGSGVVAREAMVGTVMVNTGTTSRDAFIDGAVVNMR